MHGHVHIPQVLIYIGAFTITQYNSGLNHIVCSEEKHGCTESVSLTYGFCKIIVNTNLSTRHLLVLLLYFLILIMVIKNKSFRFVFLTA